MQFTFHIPVTIQNQKFSRPAVVPLVSVVSLVSIVSDGSVVSVAAPVEPGTRNCFPRERAEKGGESLARLGESTQWGEASVGNTARPQLCHRAWRVGTRRQRR